MSPRWLPARLVATVSLSVLAGVAWLPWPAQAQSKFACQSNKGIPTTMAFSKRGQWVPIIQWVSQAFAADGWTPQRRCDEVTARFNQFYDSGQLKYITSGRMNGMPVICVTPQEGGACSGQLYTLKPYQDAAATVRKLIAIRNSGGKAPVLRETDQRPYIDLEQLVDQLSAAQSQPGMQQQPSTGRHHGSGSDPEPMF